MKNIDKVILIKFPKPETKFTYLVMNYCIKSETKSAVQK